MPLSSVQAYATGIVPVPITIPSPVPIFFVAILTFTFTLLRTSTRTAVGHAVAQRRQVTALQFTRYERIG